ncbi:pectate lyase 18-like, partial [Trifolium medium]|nr:pectate lyase 18-like [Trifolium medium]
GKNAIGGRNGKIYIVNDANDDNPVNPKPGTLRHAVIQVEPLWIIFARDMVIKLKEELIMNSFKTIDGRGASVHIAGGTPRDISGGGLYRTVMVCPFLVEVMFGLIIVLCLIVKMV